MIRYLCITHARCNVASANPITFPTSLMEHGTQTIAVIEDPDGYTVELLEPLS